MRPQPRLSSPRSRARPRLVRVTTVMAWCLLLIVSPAAMAQWESSVEDALSRAETTGRPLVVLITGGAWCDPCTWMDENSLTSPELRSRLQEEWIALRIPDTDPAWQRWDVARLPTILFLDSQGQELERTVGAVTADSLVRTMTQVRRELVLENDDADATPTAVTTVTTLETGTRYGIGSGIIWNDGGAVWFTEDAGLPPRLEEYDRDEAFLYLRDGSSGTILAITVAEDVPPSLWRWIQSERRWREIGELEPPE